MVNKSPVKKRKKSIDSIHAVSYQQRLMVQNTISDQKRHLELFLLKNGGEKSAHKPTKFYPVRQARDDWRATRHDRGLEHTSPPYSDYEPRSGVE